MPLKSLITELGDRLFVGVVGLMSVIWTWQFEDLKRILITALSMAIGTVISHYVKKWLNKR